MTARLYKTCITILVVPSRQTFCIRSEYSSISVFFIGLKKTSLIVPSTLIVNAIAISLFKLLQFFAFFRFLKVCLASNVHTRSILIHLSVPLIIEHWVVPCDLIVNLFVWGNLKGVLHIPSQNSFYGMPKPLVNCVEPICLICHSMPNISVMSPDLNGICATFGHSLRMYAAVFSFPLRNLHVEDISSLLMWCFMLFFLGPESCAVINIPCFFL